ARDDGLWISGARGVAKLAGPLRSLKAGSAPTEFIPPADLQLQNFHSVQEEENGGFSVLAESAQTQKASLARYAGQHWTAQTLNVERLRFAWRGTDKTWIATTDSLFELPDGQPEATPNDDLPVRRIFDVAVEPGGSFWLA